MAFLVSKKEGGGSCPPGRRRGRKGIQGKICCSFFDDGEKIMKARAEVPKVEEAERYWWHASSDPRRGHQGEEEDDGKTSMI